MPQDVVVDINNLCFNFYTSLHFCYLPFSCKILIMLVLPKNWIIMGTQSMNSALPQIHWPVSLSSGWQHWVMQNGETMSTLIKDETNCKAQGHCAARAPKCWYTVSFRSDQRIWGHRPETYSENSIKRTFAKLSFFMAGRSTSIVEKLLSWWSEMQL